MASQIGLLLISFVLFSKGIHFACAKNCEYEHKYVCGIQDCNCRYVSETGVSIPILYRRFKALFSQNNDDGKICDKCDVFCSKEKHINCHNGACDKQKGCICRDCWSGETCSKYHNNLPVFKESLYVAEITEDTNVGEEILKVSAVDPDMETCVDKQNCPCGQVKYSINKGNVDRLLFINPDNGVISLTRKLYDIDQYNPISLTIMAENEGDLNTVEDNQSDKPWASVLITVKNDELENGVRERRSLHHRARRSVTTPYESLAITFEPVSQKTFFDAGCTINYRVFLVQNSSASPETLSNITIQLSSENLELNTAGYSVNVSNVVKTPSLKRNDSNTMSFIVSDSMSKTDGFVEIKFKAHVRKNLDPLALLQVKFTMNATAASSGSVTIGPKYSTEVYTTYPEIKFARTTEGDVLVESTLNYNVNISLPYFNFTFTLEITTIVNDFRFLSIKDVQLGHISNSVVAQYQNPTPTKYTGANDNITSRVVLNFGKISVLNPDQNANTMKLSFSVKANDHHLLENNSIHWVGLGAHSGEEMLWVGQDAIQFSKDEPYLYAEVKALNCTNSTRYYINDVLRYSWRVMHANASYESAHNVKIKFYFSKSTKWLDNGAKSGLDSIGTTGTSVEAGREVLTFTYTKNSGILSKNESPLGGIIALSVQDTVTSLAELNVEIQILYKTSKAEDRPVRTYKPNPGYFAGVPSFNLTSNVANRVISIGQPVEITVKILINKITVEGNFYAILPVRHGSAIMRFLKHESFSTKSSGTNVQVTQTFTDAKPTFSSTTSDKTYYDRAEVDLGLIKNKALADVALSSIEDNTVTLPFKVVLEDSIHIGNQSSYKIGVGVKGSENMVWISQMTFIANVALNRRPRLQIEAYSMNTSDSLIQGSVIVYNFTISHKDGSNAHAMNVEVLWMLPIYTKYLHINQKSHEEISPVMSRNNVVFKLKRLEFGETPTVSFSVALDADKTIKKKGKTYAVTPVALTYKNKQHDTYYEPLVPISVQFKVPEQPTPIPPNAVEGFYKRGFLVDSSNSAIYICSLASKRNKPSCFWTDTKGVNWRAVDVMVVSIIGIHNGTKAVYGVGNNMLSYMKYIPNKAKWYSISRTQWVKDNSTLSDHEIIKIEDGDADDETPAADKQKDIGNGEKWGATNTGVFHFSSSNGWQRKALWNSCY